MKRIEVITAAGHSGSGKTMITCGLLKYLRHQGYTTAAFKCGPDYIDPMYHCSVEGVESHNLDLYLANRDTVTSIYKRYSCDHDAAVIEGVMGIHDGVGGTPQASTSDLSKTLGIPILYIINAGDLSDEADYENRNSLISTMKECGDIAALFINRCSDDEYQGLKDLIEKGSDIPVIGYLPETEYADVGSRHLGLMMAGELEDLSERIGHITDEMVKRLDKDLFRELFSNGSSDRSDGEYEKAAGEKVRLAVARDEAFCFIYEESLDALRDEGVEIVFFSPLHDKALPEEADGLYLPGGYPELHAAALSQNKSMRESIASAISAGLPTIAECGGFIYMGETLSDSDGTEYPMCGVLEGHSSMSGHLVRFGYAEMTAESDGMLLKKGEHTNIHEFHYYESDNNGSDTHCVKPVGRKNWDECYNTPTMYAGFPHLYMAGDKRLAKRFADAMRNKRG